MKKQLPHCDVELTVMLISDRWKILILRDLLTGTKRFGELKKIGKRHSAKSAHRSFAFDGKRRSCKPQNIRENLAACRIFPHGNGLELKAGFGCNGLVGQNVSQGSLGSVIHNGNKNNR